MNASNPGTRIATTLAAGAALLLTAGTGPALASGAVTKAGDTITFTATAGEANTVNVSVSGSDVRIDDATAVTASAPCSVDSGDAVCPFDSDDVVVIDLGDQGDRFSTGPGVTIPLTINAGEGDDGALGALEGGAGPDTLHGGPGNDTLAGMDGNDTVNGDAGSDSLFGGVGADTLNGGDGEDTLEGGDGADTLNGGADLDNASYLDKAAGATVTATLDGRANDGLAGENDFIAGDVEDLAGGDAADRFTGDAGFNALTGNAGDDVLDPGLGEDVVRGGLGNDAITVRDGYADLVDCSLGTDLVVADMLDRVPLNCETVDRAGVPSGRDDRPPTVSFAGPSENAFLPTASASTITALAEDDNGVAEVRLIDDGRVVETDTTAPYTFRYRPRGEDVGRNTLVLLAVDTVQQTASAVRPLRVMRFAPRLLIGKVTPTRDRFAPFAYRTTGRIRLPRGVTRAQGCKGRVSIQVKRGSKTISSRRVALGSRCGFSSRVVFHDRRRVGSGTLRFVVRFLGNSVLIPRSGLTLRARTR